MRNYKNKPCCWVARLLISNRRRPRRPRPKMVSSAPGTFGSARHPLFLKLLREILRCAHQESAFDTHGDEHTAERQVMPREGFIGAEDARRSPRSANALDGVFDGALHFGVARFSQVSE